MLIEMDKDKILAQLSEHLSQYNRFDCLKYSRITDIRWRQSKEHLSIKVLFMVERRNKK